MSVAWSYLKLLTRHPHRGSATPREAAAALDLQNWLATLGYDVRLQAFRAPRDTLYLGPALVLAGQVLGAALALWQPWAGLLLCLICLIPLIGEMLGSRLDFDLILPHYPSQNVVARRAPNGGTVPSRTLVISAHYDTQRASLLFHPRMAPYLQGYFYLVYVGLMLVPLGIALRQAWPWAGWVLAAGCLLSAANAALLLACRLSGRHTNGANDNGTGVALALALARHLAGAAPSGTELLVVLTGCEEVGTRGMKRFVRHAGLDRGRTAFLNLDNLGGGRLTYLMGEGMLRWTPYDADLQALAREVAEAEAIPLSARRNLLLPTDGLVPALHGYRAISFLAFAPDGSLPDYHWHTDRLDRIDPAHLALVERFLTRYATALSHARPEFTPFTDVTDKSGG